MIEINGAYNSAVIFSDVEEKNAIEQIRTLLNQEFFAGNKVRVMPDYHVGAGCTIGLTSTLQNKKVSPNLVGVDIGCGMLAIQFDGNLDFEKLDGVIRERVPSGFAIRNTPHEYAHWFNFDDLHCDDVNIHRAERSIGTLGGGNHFIEVAKGDTGTWLVIHTGSRNLGKQVAEYYQKLAIETLKKNISDARKLGLDKLKKQNRHEEISSWLTEFDLVNQSVPDSLAYVQGLQFEAYIRDMMFAQEFASTNRFAISKEILDGMGWKIINHFTSVHNYIDTHDMIMRKGACSAKAGQNVIIPVNMRDGSIIAVGKGNEDWNQSAPHGAGRVLARGEARRKLKVEEFISEMEGIFSTSISENTLDESPMAYKDIDYLVRNIADTVEIKDIIRPLYNFKAN